MLALSLGLLLAPAAAARDDDWSGEDAGFLRLYGGLSSPGATDVTRNVPWQVTTGSLNVSTGGTLGLAFGIQGARWWRVDIIDLSWRRAGIDGGTIAGMPVTAPSNLDVGAMMLNVHLVPWAHWRISPSVMAGLGGALGWAAPLGRDLDGGVSFAWNLGAGCDVRLTKRLALTGQYRYLGSALRFNEPSIGAVNFQFGSHELTVGAAYYFF